MYSAGTYCRFKGYSDVWEGPLMPDDLIVIMCSDCEGAYRCVRVDQTDMPRWMDTELVFEDELRPVGKRHLDHRHFACML